MEAAKGGDMTAARLVLERIAPVRAGGGEEGGVALPAPWT